MNAPFFPNLLLACLLLSSGAVASEQPQPTKLEVLAMTSVPDGKYTVRLELKQLDGEATTVELQARGGSLESSSESKKLGKIHGKAVFIGNGVFMVQLKGTAYVATQFWVFRPDGSAAIKEIPDRGETQIATPAAATRK